MEQNNENLNDLVVEQGNTDKKKRNRNVKRIKLLEAEILQQTIRMKQGQDYYQSLVDEYNSLLKLNS